jgi:hypothetical protein
MASRYPSTVFGDEAAPRMRQHHLPHSAPMTISRRAMGIGVISVALLSSCVFDGSEPTTEEVGDSDPVPGESVVIPTERLTPFCQAMIDLTDRVRAGDVDATEIVEAYRAIEDDVPAELADDFALVLEALEAGAPAPTDPPRGTIQTVPRSETTPPSTDESAATTEPPPTQPPTTDDDSLSGESSVPTTVVVDERFDRDDSPAERINSYVSFTCRASDNNPGPPPTQPLDGPPATDGD